MGGNLVYRRKHTQEKHIKEWSQFFADKKEVNESIIDKFLKRYQKRKYLKQSLRRLQEKGFIIQKDSKLIPTKKGRRFFKRYALLNSHNTKEQWDGKWRLISFDVPVKDDKKRVQLRTLLKEFSFCQLQKSVWVCPNQIGEKLWQLLVEYELDKYCSVMVVEIIEGDEKLKKYFNIP